MDLTALFTGWLTVAVAATLVIMSPGPNTAMTLRNSLLHSRRAGVSTAAGLALGDAIHVAYCLMGIAVIISQSILLFNVVKWAGAAYLIYIGIKSLRNARKRGPRESGEREPSLQPMTTLTAVRSGFLTSLLNPKVTLFFLALFTQVIRPDTPLLVKGFYGLTVVGIEFCWCALVATLVSTSPVERRFDTVAHWIERATGAILVLLGLRLALTKPTG